MSERPYPINLGRFEKWLGKQDPKAKYRYEDVCGCPLARFIAEAVKPRQPTNWCADWPFVVVSSSLVLLGDAEGRPLDPSLNAVVRNGLHTYGHLLDRVRALRKRQGPG